MINIGRHPCNYDRLDFSEHETGDAGQGDCDMFSVTVGLFSLDSAFMCPGCLQFSSYCTSVSPGPLMSFKLGITRFKQRINHKKMSCRCNPEVFNVKPFLPFFNLTRRDVVVISIQAAFSQGSLSLASGYYS